MPPLEPQPVEVPHRIPSPPTGVLLVMGALGFAAAVVQLAMMRELLAGLGGNELTMGVALSCWLLLTAGGTWFGARLRVQRIDASGLALALVMVAAVAVLQLIAIRAGRDWVFRPGETPGPLAGIACSLVILAPFCLGSGALLTLGCRARADSRDGMAIGRIYMADTSGAIAGAALFTFGLSRWLDHGAALCATVAIVAAAAATVTGRRNLIAIAMAIGVAAAFATLALLPAIDALTTQWQYRGRVVLRATSPYGRLVVTRNAGQLTFFENGVPVVFTANTAAREEIVHYALAQRPRARTVLLIGGSVGGAAQEVLRYPDIQRVTVIELDPAIVAAASRLRPDDLADPRIDVVVADARRFLQRTVTRYDAVIVVLPDPTTFQLNRFYTADFVALVRHALQPDGVLALGVGNYENVVGPELRQLLRSMRATLATAFAETILLPGTRVFFISSEGALTRDIAGALEAAGVSPRLINRHYLGAILSADRLADLERATATAASPPNQAAIWGVSSPINRDLHPILYWLRLRHWISQFSWPAMGLVALLSGVMALSLLGTKRAPRLIFAAGFAGSALEVVVLVAYQALYGSVYQQVGFIVAVFMAGLATGAAIANRAGAPAAARAFTVVPPIAAVRTLGLVIAALAAALPWLLSWLRQPTVGPAPWLGQACLGAFTAVLAFAAGAQFAFAGRTGGTDGAAAAKDEAANAREQAPRLFSADLVGAALGALAVSALLLPLYGAAAVCFVTAALNAGCVAVSFAPVPKK